MTWLFGPATRLGPAAVADAAAGRRGRAGRPQPHRRPVAQRGAGPDRHAPAGVLRAALGGAAAQPLRRRRGAQRRTRSPRCARRFTPATGRSPTRELLLVSAARRRRADRLRRGRPAPLLRRRLDRRRPRRARGLPAGARRLAGRAPIADVLARCAEVDGRCPRRWRRSTWRCGTSPAADAGSRCGGCSGPRPRRPSPSTGRSPPPTAPAPPARPPQARADGLRDGQGQGRRSATTPAGWPRCGRSPAREMAIRIDANGAWSADEAQCGARAAGAGRDRAVRGAGPRAADAIRDLPGRRDGAARARRVRRAIPRRSLARRAADLICLKIARCGGIIGHDRRRRAAPGRPATRSTSPRRSTARSGSPRRCTPPRVIAPDRACGLATLGLFDGPPGPPAGVAGRSRSAGGPGSAARRWSTGTAPGDDLGDRGRVPRGERRARRRATTVQPRGRQRAAIRSAMARNFSSRSPTTSSTGIPSSPRRSHSDGSAPVPSPRRAAGEPGRRVGAAARRARRPGHPAAGRRAPASAPSARRTARSSALHLVGQRLVGGPPGAALDRRRPGPGLAPISTSRCTRPGSASATCSAIRPPIE